MSKIYFDPKTIMKMGRVGVSVKFASHEMKQIVQVALNRHKSQRGANRHDHSVKSNEGVKNDLIGALGEVAVRDAFDFKEADHITVLPIPQWEAMRREKNLTDVGGFEVRSVGRDPEGSQKTSLIAKQDTDAGKKDVIFVLAVPTKTWGLFDSTVLVMGWAYGREIMVPEYMELNVDRPNYFMPLGDTRSIESLYELQGKPFPKTLLEQDEENYRDLNLAV